MRSLLRFIPIALLLLAGCGSFMIGSLYPRSERLMLAHDRPQMHSRMPEGEPNGTVGVLEKKAGEMISGLGFWKGGMIYDSYYLVREGGKEFFLLRDDIWNENDQLFRRCQGRFRLDAKADPVAWQRARSYILDTSPSRIEVSNNNLIKTSAPTDTLSTGYTITRVPITATEFEYEIIATSIRPDFRADSAAAALGYYMTTGNWYSYVE
jgi:hypothetical protein